MNSIGIMAFVLLNIKMSLYIERFVFFFLLIAVSTIIRVKTTKKSTTTRTPYQSYINIVLLCTDVHFSVKNNN